jgi:nitroimidazol reductase NimA-like FMN-containing flavoprotein (pyridoxamine 5'-phosphate oxidase superfamily)
MRTDPDAHALALLEANTYLTLATADADGVPWATPVWFAFDAPARRLLWVSAPGARHSQNLAARPLGCAVVFDSTVAPRDAAAVYVSGRAGERDTAEIAAYSARSVALGLAAWTPEDVAGAARMRLYGLDVEEAWVLDQGIDRRVPALG